MKIFKGNIIWMAVLAMFFVSLWSCAGNVPEAQRIDYLNMNFGNSYESAMNNQILNPDAGENLEPVVGLDGKAAEYTVDRYKKSFEKEQELKTSAGTFKILNSSGGSGSGSK
ncbi:MAG TPA: hypothetical protein VKA34_02035 [Balneolales bacterium]|nr:hypothetical protein [Balneolales bacterium]